MLRSGEHSGHAMADPTARKMFILTACGMPIEMQRYSCHASIMSELMLTAKSSVTGPSVHFAKILHKHIHAYCKHTLGARGSVVVKALCCKPESRGFKSR
jgi:hypothetical protein